MRNQAGMKLHQVEPLVHLTVSQLSKIENGHHGPPSDEVIEGLAEAYSADPVELLRIAGRDLNPEAFQQRVLADLEELRTELRAGFERLEAKLSQPGDG